MLPPLTIGSPNPRQSPEVTAPGRLPARRAGFALLVTITLVALLVLILVALAVLTRVETQVADNSRQSMQARQNALLALNVALGRLQLAAGPDQRATATAAMGEGATAITAAEASRNGLAPPSAGTRHWTGVWGNRAPPEAIFTGSPQPVLLDWLVSGNEGAPAVVAESDGHISSPEEAAATPFHPGQAVTLSEGGALSGAITATTPLRIDGEPAALLLGPQSAGSDAGAYVAAPLVAISADPVPGLDGPAVVGRFAWWVGDEGVKARYNLADPYIANASPGDAGTEDGRHSRYRLLAAQRHGIERMFNLADGFDDTNYPVAATPPGSTLYQGVRHTLAPAQARLASPGVSPDILQLAAHDLTTWSRGVLADSQFGGLRRDLTFHLDPRSGDTFLDGRKLLPDGATPLSTFPGSRYSARPSLFSETTLNGGLGFMTLDVSPRLGPHWDQVKSFYRLGHGQPGDLEVRPAVDLDANPVEVQAAISPVILEVRTLFGLSAVPSIDTAIVLVLGNPYTRRLTAPDGLNLRIALNPNRHSSTGFYGEEMGLIVNFVGPTPPESSEEKRKISSVFTRRWGNRSQNYPAGTAPAAPPLQMDYVNPETLDRGQHDGGNTVFHHYYPIMKFPRPASGDGPPDPHPNAPGVLDEVVFQIPPGVLDLEPGEARAYQVNPSGSLPDETIDGIAMKAVPLREMTNSWDVTYYKHPCDPAYVSAPEVFSPSDVTGDSFFRAGLNITNDRGAWSAGWTYTLGIPGKPRAVLQTFGSIGHTQPDTLSNQMLPANTIYGQPFGASPTPVSGTLHRKAFRDKTVSQAMDAAMYAERNQVGRAQRTGAFYNSGAGTNPYVTRPLLYTDNAYLRTEEKFTEDLDPGRAAQAAWGAGEIGNPIRFSPEGRLVLLDAPAAHSDEETSLLSLGQLQHADLTADDEALGVNSQPNHVVGNSWYNRLVPRETSRTAPMDNLGSRKSSNWADTGADALGNSPSYPGFVPDLPKMTQIRRYDMSYLANAALWDTFFFSTVRPAAGSDAAPAPLPANRRLVWLGGSPTLGQLRGADASAALPRPADLGPGENGRAPAAQLLADGAFNVNSTSVEAWKAVLSGLRGLALDGAPEDATLTPFARSIRQPGRPQGDLPANPWTREETYTGYRALTDAQVTELATRIVEQVKARGPFLSLSQFVNRHLEPAGPATGASQTLTSADTGLAGALQQAIDRAGLNQSLNAQPLRRDNTTVVFPDDALMPVNSELPGADVSGLGRHMGAPGWLTQADVLQAIGPGLAARSDTFVIRAYGEVTDPVNSPAAPADPVVRARAWCEVVVQRLPDWLDPADQPTVRPADATAANRTFGRRFHVVSFRWLSADDI